MSQIIMVGCDLHDCKFLVRFALGQGEPREQSFSNDSLGRGMLVERLKSEAAKHGVQRIVLAYEASGQGYGLSDFLHGEGIECYVLSPTHLPKTPKSAKQKTDSKDAQMLLEQVRGFVLAGNRLPMVWTPPQRLRDDRDLVRARIDAADDATRIKLQILSLFKRHGLLLPSWFTSWTKRFIQWLHELPATMDPVVAPVLESLITRFELYRAEQEKLKWAVEKLSRTDRYQAACAALRKIPGVGLLTAMMFLTEMGDLSRFHNRREVAAYLGLCPSSYESGEANDRKGHITRQGPGRMRKLLCQAAWVAVRRCDETKAAYARIKGSKKSGGKKALVAIMRCLAIKMWHRALECGPIAELRGRGGPHEPIVPPQPLAGVA